MIYSIHYDDDDGDDDDDRDKIYVHAISIFTMMMIIFSESYPNTNMTGFKWFSKIFESLRFEQK